MNTFGRIREAAAEVARRARFVRLDEDRAGDLAGRLVATLAEPPLLDPAHHHRGDDASTLAFVVTLDAVNFGSGWFPFMRKRPGCSGYFTVATALTEHFDRAGPLSAGALAAATTEGCAELFDQDPAVPEMAELMAHFAAAWRELGRFLQDRFDGRFEGLVEAARSSAARWVDLLAQLPHFHDVSRYDELEVPLFKRAQLAAADLALAFEGRGPGRFDDLDELTIFADNLVPHVLRREGVLDYDPDLAARIDAGTPIGAGTKEEVEIRAVALHAVETMTAQLSAAGHAFSAQRIDYALWSRGQSPEMKAHPRHRTRTVYY
ncbi:MAG: queuosine salvage family protein [Myxococcota bacterium]